MIDKNQIDNLQIEKAQIDKAKVALRFAQAGQSYTEHAVVQKQIAKQLFDLIVQYCPDILKLNLAPHFNNAFEIGCGSGNLSHLLIENLKIKYLVLNDLYPEIKQHFQSNPNIDYLIGDIEQLEFPEQLDFIVSSSAFQWINDLDAIFAKAKYSLNEQGFFCFSTFGQQNLKEIKMLTGQGLDYLTLENIQEKLQKQGFEILHISEQIESLQFEHPKQILQHLKATGVTATASKFRWTKQSLMDFYHSYQQFSFEDKFNQQPYPLTYHPIYCIARRNVP